jgi:phage replication O-like protein O
MADVQPEYGYTKIANQIMDQLAKTPLSPTESQTVWAIFRMTYGYHRKKYTFKPGELSIITKLHRNRVSEAIRSLKLKNMIVATQTRSVRGLTICFQKDYEKWKVLGKQVVLRKSGTPATQRRNAKGFSPIIYKEKKKKVPLEEFSLLKKRYAHPEIIEQAFAAISSTRKSGCVAESILWAQLQKWSRYPVEQVEAGIQTYIDKDYAGQGKGEKYLLGIIRNSNGATAKKQTPTVPEWF